MTNTLTWDIKSIQVPKVNANLLSVISLILLLTMAFMVVHPALASHCDDIRGNLETALAVEAAALIAIPIARQLVKAAAGNPWALAAAMAGLGLAIGTAAAAGAAVGYYAHALYECEKEHESASGGCDSGGCGSG